MSEISIDEAIAHCEERAKADCSKCAEEHMQFKQWLMELCEYQQKVQRCIERIEQQRNYMYREDGSLMSERTKIKIDKVLEIIKEEMGCER